MSVELEGNARPVSYDVTISPCMSWGESQPPSTMVCRMVMRWESLDPINHLVLHSCDIGFQDIEVEVNGKVIDNKDITLLVDSPRQLARIDFNLFSGTSGILRTRHTAQLRGLTSKGGVCVSQQNSSPVMITHFEPLCARSLIPCFDCPSMKAPFQLTVIKDDIPSHFTILSNTPVEEESESRVRFKQTTRICSYLFAFVIADLHSISTTSSSGIKLSVYAPRTRDLEEARSSLHVLKQTISFFEDYFDLRLNMSKLDIIGIPMLPAIAMENHCCLVFRLNYLLISRQTPLNRIQRIVRLVAHEVSHHWFGNSTSLDSWDSIWLKEGFARYLEYLCTDKLFPSWGFWGDFHITVVEEMKVGDCVNVHRRPLEVHAPTVSSVVKLFDRVCYAKGASLVKMIRHVIGEETFRSSVCKFLKNTVDGNGSPRDLFNIIDSLVPSNLIPGMTVTEWFEPWKRNESLPVVCIRQSSATAISLLAVRHPSILRCEEGDLSSLFPVFIEIEICCGTKVRREKLLIPPGGATEQHLSIPEMVDGSCVVVANPDASTYCRCLYDDTLTNRLLKNFKTLTETCRLNLITDTSSLLHISTMSGQGKAVIQSYLPTGVDPLFKYFEAIGLNKETDNFVVSAAATAALDLALKGFLYSTKLKQYILTGFEHLLPEVERVAYSEAGVATFGEYRRCDQLTAETAASVLQALGFCESEDALSLCSKLQAELIKRMNDEGGERGTDFLIVAMSAVKAKVLHGGLDDWCVAWSMYEWVQTMTNNDSDPFSDHSHNHDDQTTSLTPPFPTIKFPLVGTLPIGYNLLGTVLETLFLSKHEAVNDFIVSLILEDNQMQIEGRFFSLALGLLVNYHIIDGILPKLVKSKFTWTLLVAGLNYGSVGWLRNHKGLHTPRFQDILDSGLMCIDSLHHSLAD
eukprot:TRINITY_DN1803_c1_g1_i3.p1 TRINITY_DN1803_c1_g1~~TRINITY_DN1803_c1_g1_i3.p1  ORF type:complete len:916 (+),score=166.34 TRINITY_DN1803_c1_g1_i3:548-3295(+)